MHPTHLQFILQQVLSAPLSVPPEAQQAANGGLLLWLASTVSQIKVNGFVSVIIQYLKVSKLAIFDWVSTNTPWVTRGLSATAAALTAVGIHWTFTVASGTLTITGLTLSAIIGALYGIAQNYLFQHAWYKILFYGPVTPAIPASPAQVATVTPTVKP